MAATRLMHTWRPSAAVGFSSSSQMRLSSVKVECMSNAIGFNLEKNNGFIEDEERKQVVLLAKASSVAVTPIKRSEGVEVTALVAVVRSSLVLTRTRSWRSVVQSFIEKAVIDCRFFTMFAVAGTLFGSVLCFLEGTILVIESYIQCFQSLSLHSDNGRIVPLLIESLDMFLVGTAMLVFGMGLHVMFVRSKSLKSKGMQLWSSNFFGMFYLKNIPSWVGMTSVTQAKSMIGFSLMLLLQVGVLEKFKSIPLVTGLDLACFAGAIFVSSAGLFILSKLNLDS